MATHAVYYRLLINHLGTGAASDSGTANIGQAPDSGDGNTELAAPFQRIRDPEASLPVLRHEELLAFEC